MRLAEWPAVIIQSSSVTLRWTDPQRSQHVVNIQFIIMLQECAAMWGTHSTETQLFNSTEAKQIASFFSEDASCLCFPSCTMKHLKRKCDISFPSGNKNRDFDNAAFIRVVLVRGFGNKLNAHKEFIWVCMSFTNWSACHSLTLCVSHRKQQ